MASPKSVCLTGGGIYTYDGRGHYTEFLTYHSLPHLVGKRIDFTCRLDGDLWYHDAVYEVDGATAEIHEVWRRLHDSKPFLPDSLKAPERKKPLDAGTTWVPSCSDQLAGD
jgi:hypothetical protein